MEICLGTNAPLELSDLFKFWVKQQKASKKDAQRMGAYFRISKLSRNTQAFYCIFTRILSVFVEVSLFVPQMMPWNDFSLIYVRAIKSKNPAEIIM